MGDFKKVAALSDVPVGQSKIVEADGKEIALWNVDGKICAITNVCPHQGGPLGEGSLEGTTVICPWHSWVFDVCTGVSPVNPRARVATYEVKVEGNEIFVSVQEAL